jgi:hypothetical protein
LAQNQHAQQTIEDCYPSVAEGVTLVGIG